MLTDTAFRLTAEQKWRAIELIDAHRLSAECAACIFHCTVAEIATIISVRDKLMHAKVEFDALNAEIYSWYRTKSGKNIAVAAATLQKYAKRIAANTGHTDFVASSGWLASFKSLYQISLSDSNQPPVTSDLLWLSKLSTITSKHQSKDIATEIEIVLHYPKNVGPNGGCAEKFTVFFVCYADGSTERLVMIGANTPRSAFQNLDTTRLPVEYRCNADASLTTDIFENYLCDLNEKMKASQRNILLFVENASCDPNLSFSNIELQFVVASVAQPLKYGIVEHFKANYGDALLTYFLQSSGSSAAVGAIQTIDALNVMYLLTIVLKQNRRSCVRKCFYYCGFPITLTAQDLDTDESCNFSEFYNRNRASQAFGGHNDHNYSVPKNESVAKGTPASSTIARTSLGHRSASKDDSCNTREIVTVQVIAECVNKLRNHAISAGDSFMFEKVRSNSLTSSSSDEETPNRLLSGTEVFALLCQMEDYAKQQGNHLVFDQTIAIKLHLIENSLPAVHRIAGRHASRPNVQREGVTTCSLRSAKRLYSHQTLNSETGSSSSDSQSEDSGNDELPTESIKKIEDHAASSGDCMLFDFIKEIRMIFIQFSRISELEHNFKRRNNETSSSSSSDEQESTHTDILQLQQIFMHLRLIENYAKRKNDDLLFMKTWNIKTKLLKCVALERKPGMEKPMLILKNMHPFILDTVCPKSADSSSPKHGNSKPVSSVGPRSSLNSHNDADTIPCGQLSRKKPKLSTVSDSECASGLEDNNRVPYFQQSKRKAINGSLKTPWICGLKKSALRTPREVDHNSKDAGTVLHIFDLDNIYLLKLFDYFDLKELIALESVCKRFKAFSELKYRNFQSYAFDIDDKASATTCRMIFRKIGPSLKRLSLKLDEDDDKVERVIDIVGDACATLETITLIGFEIQESMKIKMWKLLSNVVKLELNHCILKYFDADAISMATQLRRIAMIGCCSTSNLILALRRIEECIFEDNYENEDNLDDEYGGQLKVSQILLFLRKNPQLRRLKIIDNTNDNNPNANWMEAFVACQPRLIELYINNIVVRHTLWLRSLKHLRYLIVKNNKRVDDILRAINECAITLVALNVESGSLTDVGLNELTHMASLRYLNLNCCQIDENYVARQAATTGDCLEHLANLTELHLADIRGVWHISSHNFVKMIRTMCGLRVLNLTGVEQFKWETWIAFENEFKQLPSCDYGRDLPLKIYAVNSGIDNVVGKYIVSKWSSPLFKIIFDNYSEPRCNIADEFMSCAQN